MRWLVTLAFGVMALGGCIQDDGPADVDSDIGDELQPEAIHRSGSVSYTPHGSTSGCAVVTCQGVAVPDLQEGHWQLDLAPGYYWGDIHFESTSERLSRNMAPYAWLDHGDDFYTVDAYGVDSVTLSLLPVWIDGTMPLELGLYRAPAALTFASAGPAALFTNGGEDMEADVEVRLHRLATQPPAGWPDLHWSSSLASAPGLAGVVCADAACAAEYFGDGFIYYMFSVPEGNHTIDVRATWDGVPTLQHNLGVWTYDGEDWHENHLGTYGGAGAEESIEVPINDAGALVYIHVDRSQQSVGPATSWVYTPESLTLDLSVKSNIPAAYVS